jgi:ribosome-interacting GTPase 1
LSSNIGPEAQAAYAKYLDANSIDEKIKKLEEFLSLVPKHKGTEKIVALNKSRLSKLKRQQEENKQRLKSTGKKSPFSIKKEGIQIICISDYYTPGVGKTSLLNYMTGAAKDKIGKFTAIPEIGIFRYKKIRYQIVDMPSIMENASKGIGNGKEILSQLRSCDLICISIDLTRNVDKQMKLLLNEFSSAYIKINEAPPPITVEKTGANKVQVFYLTKEAKEIKDLISFTENVKELVTANGIKNAIVKIYGNVTVDQIVDALTPSMVYKKTIIIATKGDLPHTEDQFEKLKLNYSDKFPVIIGVSVKTQNFPNDFGEIVLNFLNKIKIYTVNAGIVALAPLILDRYSTVRDVAIKIHKSFFNLFDYATIIRKSAQQGRKKVGLEYELEDGDLIEIHTR